MLTLCNDSLSQIFTFLSDGRTLYALSSTCELFHTLLERKEVWTKLRTTITEDKHNLPLEKELANEEELHFVAWYEKNYYTRKCVVHLHPSQALHLSIINFDFEYALLRMQLSARDTLEFFSKTLPSLDLSPEELSRLAEFAVGVYDWFATHAKERRRAEKLLLQKTYALHVDSGREEEFLAHFPSHSQVLVTATFHSPNATADSWRHLVTTFGEAEILLQLRIELCSSDYIVAYVPEPLPKCLAVLDAFGKPLAGQVKQYLKIYANYFSKCLMSEGRGVDRGREEYAARVAEVHKRLSSC